MICDTCILGRVGKVTVMRVVLATVRGCRRMWVRMDMRVGWLTDRRNCKGWGDVGYVATVLFSLNCFFFRECVLVVAYGVCGGRGKTERWV